MIASSRPFEELTPDAVLAAAESLGIDCDARLFALNSYENRVYQLGSTSHGMLVLKFYRPARWSDAQILEEHVLAAELVAGELPVAAPMTFDGRTLHQHGGLRFAVFPRIAAQPPRSMRAAQWILLDERSEECTPSVPRGRSISVRH